MNDLTLFYLESCPYCQNARKALQELAAEKPEYASVKIDWIEESRQPALAEQFDYYYVPSVFLGKDKLYEAAPGESYSACKEHLAGALDAALQKA